MIKFLAFILLISTQLTGCEFLPSMSSTQITIVKENLIPQDQRWRPYVTDQYNLTTSNSPQTKIQLTMKGIHSEDMMAEFTVDQHSNSHKDPFLEFYGVCQAENEVLPTLLFTRRGGGNAVDQELFISDKTATSVQLINLGDFVPYVYVEHEDLIQCSTQQTLKPYLEDNPQATFEDCQCNFKQRLIQLSENLKRPNSLHSAITQN